MALTPDSSTASYLTPNEFILRYDANLVCQLVSDTGSPVTSNTLSTNQVLLTLLAEASGMLEQSALVGGRYSPSDLITLSQTDGNGNALYVGGAVLKKIVADIAIGLLRNRRGMSTEAFPAYLDAMEQLKLLREGEIIFPFREAELAGQLSDSPSTTYDFYRQHRISVIYRRFFGLRADEYPGT